MTSLSSDDIVSIIKDCFYITSLFEIIYIAILLHLFQNSDTSISSVHMTLLHLAVGCKHTGYKSLMAGLVTEWIYDAFAGISSFICILNLFHKTL